MAFHTTVGDDLEANVAAFRNAIDRADIVVATGGLGPTADDLTREALARGRRRRFGAGRGGGRPHPRPVCPPRPGDAGAEPAAGPVPARQPAGAQSPRHGPRHRHGGPAAVWPAVPRLRPAWRAGRNVRHVGGDRGPRDCRDACRRKRVILHRRIKCFGVGESDLEAMLPDMIRRKREPLVGITVSGATITLRITASGPNEAACLRAMEPTVAQIRDCSACSCSAKRRTSWSTRSCDCLNERRQTLAVAEWATDGLVSQWLAEAATSDGVFPSGVIVRDAAAAQLIIGSRRAARLRSGRDNAEV